MREGPLVVIVDDDKSIRRAVQDLLRAAGFSTAAFGDAESFLGWPSREGAECLIADMRMPRMSGLQLHKQLVASGNDIPTIIITAYPEELTKTGALAAGIICHLTKPFTPDELLECVREALAKPRNGSPIPRS